MNKPLKCTSYALYFGVLSLGLLLASLLLTFYTTSTAKAVSAYDSTVQPIENLEITKLFGAPNYNDYSEDWYSQALEAVNAKCSNNNAYCTLYSELDALVSDENGNWAVTREVDSSEFRIFYSTATDAQSVFQMSGSDACLRITSSTAVKRTAPFYYNSDATQKSTRDLEFNWGNFEIPLVTSTSLELTCGSRGIFLSTFPVTYPQDYAGQQVPQGSVEPTILKPSIKGSVKGLNLDIYSPPNENFGDLENYWVKWVIGQGDTGCLDPNPEICPPLYFLEGMSRPDQVLSQTLPKQGNYYVQAQYVDVGGGVLQDSEEYDFQIGERLLTVDGSYYDFDNAVDECNEDGICTVAPPGDENKLVKILKSLTINTYGLQAVVNAPLNFLATLPGISQNCSPINLTLPFLNTPMQYTCLTQTVYEPHFNGILTIWQTVITAVTAYWVSIKLFATVKDINTPDNDRIEVAQL